MSRPPRIHLPGEFYHVTQRGNAKRTIFFNDRDRVRFCLLMQEGIERFGHKIHAFCLMDNHIHLLLQAGDQPISKAMQNLTFRFAMRLNKKLNTTGHQFQGRYFSRLIDSDAYLFEVLKYIHRNPVTARMVTSPSDYCWSSHNCYCGADKIPWLDLDYCLSLFDSQFSIAVQEYSSFVNFTQDEETISLIEKPKMGYIIGDDQFVEKIEKKAERVEQIKQRKIGIAEIMHVTCELLNISEQQVWQSGKNQLGSKARGIIGYIVMNYTSESVASLAKLVNRSPSTISRSIETISLLVRQTDEVEGIVDEIIATLHD